MTNILTISYLFKYLGSNPFGALHLCPEPCCDVTALAIQVLGTLMLAQDTITVDEENHNKDDDDDDGSRAR